MGKVFVSYRRSDAADIAGRIADKIRLVGGRRNVFFDVANIPVGLDFRSAITSALTQSKYFVAVIGPKWLAPGPSGSPRIHEPNDSVRIEIRDAFQRRLSIVPVLVNGATMPAAHELPPDLKELSSRNAFELRHEHWESDSTHLVDLLGGGSFPYRAARWVRRGRKQKFLAASAAFFVFSLILAFSLIIGLSDMVSAGKRFVNLLSSGELQMAYDDEAAFARRTHPYQDFVQQLQQMSLDKIKSVSWNGYDRGSEQGQMTGVAALTDGGSVPLVLTLVKERGLWKVSKVKVDVQFGP